VQSNALLFVDLDGFKEVNDSLGHEAGDAVLATIAKRIEHAVRDEDVVGRLGGDEFVVLCRSVGEDEATEIAERVRATTDGAIDVRGAQVEVGASVGVAMSFVEEAAPLLMRRADTAVYGAKRAGRGRVVLSEGPGLAAA
jgi:diguanylate cyclase (GGDEF)-like protein